jgi:hypothetical protein
VSKGLEPGPDTRQEKVAQRVWPGCVAPSVGVPQFFCLLSMATPPKEGGPLSLLRSCEVQMHGNGCEVAPCGPLGFMC